MDGHATLGAKLYLLLPRLVLFPLGGLSSRKAENEVPRRCRMFVQGQWAQLWSEAPTVFTPEAREALRDEADLRRGYAVDHDMEGVLYDIECGEPSKAMRRLLSPGVRADAWDDLVRLHIAAPEEDRNALTAEEQAQYDAAKPAPVDNAFAGRIRDELAEIFVR